MMNFFARVSGTAVFTAPREVISTVKSILELIGRDRELFADEHRHDLSKEAIPDPPRERKIDSTLREKPGSDDEIRLSFF